MNVLSLLLSLSNRLEALEQRQGSASASASASASVKMPDIASTPSVPDIAAIPSASSVSSSSRASSTSLSSSSLSPAPSGSSASSSSREKEVWDYSNVQLSQRQVQNISNGYTLAHNAHFHTQRKVANSWVKKLQNLIDTRGQELGEKKVNDLKDFINRWESNNRGTALRRYNNSGAIAGSIQYLALYLADQRWLRDLCAYVNSNGVVGPSDENGTAAYNARVRPLLPPKGERGLTGADGNPILVIETLE